MDNVSNLVEELTGATDNPELKKALGGLGKAFEARGAALTEEIKKAVAGLASADELKATNEKLAVLKSDLATQLARGAQGAETPARASLLGNAADYIRKAQEKQSGFDERTVDVRKALLDPAANADTSISTPANAGVVGVSPFITNFADYLLSRALSTTANSINYRTEVWTNAAATVAQGAAKPESSVVITPQICHMQTIAHHTSESLQMFRDVPEIHQMIEARLVQGLKRRAETMALTQTASATANAGLVTLAATHTISAGLANVYDVIGDAISAQENSVVDEFPVDMLVMNPATLWRLRLAKTADGTYIGGGAMVPGNVTPWGLPILVSKSLTANQVLVGSFSGGAQFFVRDDISIRLSYEHANNFTENLVTTLCEMRGGLMTMRATAFRKLTLPTVFPTV
jgi:HK97 family phage major capsid protein